MADDMADDVVANVAVVFADSGVAPGPAFDAVDLSASADEGEWQQLAAAADTDPLARVAVAARGQINRLTDVAVARIAAAVPGYGAADGIDRSDLWWSVYRNLELILLVLGQRRDATPEELEVRAQLGRRRADAGMDCGDITRAFRVGYQHMWMVLTRIAIADGEPASQALLGHASHVWAALDAVSSTVEQAYRARSLERDMAVRDVGLEFVAALRDYPFSSAEAAGHARSVGLDPAGRLVVAVGSGTPERPLPGAVVVELVDRTVVIVQASRDEADASLAAVLAKAGMRDIGVGLPGDGLVGAHTSLRHAELAHRSAVALGSTDVIFRRDWLECIVADAAPAIGPVLAPVIDALRASPLLAATARAVVNADGCMETAARVLFVHPNTVAYRLRRLAATTGTSPRTADGLLQLRAALTIAELSER